MTHSEALSWLKLDEAPSTPEVKAVFDHTFEKLGYVRIPQRVIAHLPSVLVAQDGLSRALMQGECPLPPKERELIALVVSVVNGCVACIFGHASRLRVITEDPVLVGEIEANYRHARLSAREMAIADYAVKLTRTPAEMREADLEPMRAQGLSETDLIWVASITAFYNLSNRVNSGLGIHANSEAYGVGR